jgi:hypothetical protein
MSGSCAWDPPGGLLNGSSPLPHSRPSLPAEIKITTDINLNLSSGPRLGLPATRQHDS